MRTVEDRMRGAVENLGCDSMAAKGLEMLQLAKLGIFGEWAKLLKNQGLSRENLVAVSGVEPPTPRI